MAGNTRKATVELVEGDDVELDDAALDNPATPGEPPAPRRPWWRWWPLALVVMLVGGGFAVVQAREAARAEARTALLADQGGFVGRIGPDMGVLWTADLGPEEYVSGTAGGLGFVSESDGTLRAFDLETGQERWTVYSEGLMTQCWGEGELSTGEPAILCESFTMAVMDADFSFTDRVLERRDSATGEVVDSREPAQHVASAWWGPDTLFLDEGDDGLVLRLEAPDGKQRWEIPVPGGRGAGPAAWIDPRADVAILWTDRHLVVDHDGQILLDVPFRDPDGSLGEWLTTGTDGSFVVAHYAEDTESVEVFGPDGTRLFETDGYVSGAALDDGEVPGLLVTVPSWGLAVWDWASGETVLEIDGHTTGLHFLLRGALIHEREGELRATDVRTGEERWHVRLDGAEVLGSDGDVVLVLSRASGPELRAVSVHTGAQVWTYPLPSADVEASWHGGALFLRDGGTLLRLATSR